MSHVIVWSRDIVRSSICMIIITKLLFSMKHGIITIYIIDFLYRGMGHFIIRGTFWPVENSFLKLFPLIFQCHFNTYSYLNTGQ